MKPGNAIVQAFYESYNDPAEFTTEGSLLSEHANRPMTGGGQEDAERICGSRSNSS